MTQQEFIEAGFTVVGTDNNENKLLNFLKENYPNVIRDTEINIEELKAVLGLPIDEKVNGYGLNFVGRNFARAKYAQKTEKELRLNTTLSKDIDTTQNLVLKGDNLDSLKILKNYYNGLIKCIYIDPPYNTASDEFVYPDKFDKEEAEVLGLANLSESDFERMEFSFKTKKSHNGWLAFMYPRLLLARDLLSKDGVIFISIDDNEQANLKLLCDDIFGEENFVSNCPRKTVHHMRDTANNTLQVLNDYVLVYSKEKQIINFNKKLIGGREFPFEDEKGKYYLGAFQNSGSAGTREARPNLYFPIYELANGELSLEPEKSLKVHLPQKVGIYDGRWLWSKEKFKKDRDLLTVHNNKIFKKVYENESEDQNRYQNEKTWLDDFLNANGTRLLNDMEMRGSFDYAKPMELIIWCLKLASNKDSIILDFFAGSGTTGHAVMQLNAEDGGNRKFILCQIDEPIKEDKPAYQFCIDNNLPPVISSITIERLKRAGERLNHDLHDLTDSNDLFSQENQNNQNNQTNHSSDNNQENHSSDFGFKVFDSVEAPKLNVDETGQIAYPEIQTDDALSRIYNMIFTVGLDEPTQVPEEIMKNCIYKIGDHYYITNSEKISNDDYSNAIKNGKVFIDGWTASLNGTLQNYKEDVKIVF